MSNNIIQSESDDVQLSDGTQVSMQVLQQTYKDLTGKNEQLSKEYRLNITATFQDLENLNSTIEHLLEQYNIQAKNCNVTIYHIDESKEIFSSFDRFRAFEASSLSPVENVRFEYSFLVVLPQAKKPETYKITIEVMSRVGITQKAKEEDNDFSMRYLHLYAATTGSMTIEYVDYAFARSFKFAIDHWFNGLPQNKQSSVLKFLKRQASHMSFAIFFLTTIVTSIGLYKYVGGIVGGIAFNRGLQLGIASFSAIFLVGAVAARLGMLISQSIDRYFELSYLDLNRGDKNAIADFKAANTRARLMFIGGLILAVLVNLFSGWLGKLLNL